MSGEALWEVGTDSIDEVLESQQRVRDLPFSLMLEDGEDGSRARSVLGSLASYNFGEAHGQLVAVDYGIMAMSTPLAGRILRNEESTGTDDGTAVQLGAVASDEQLVAALHVCGGSGRVTVRIESDNLSGFGSPTTRLTFTAVATGTPRAYQWRSIGGPHADSWWRVVVANQSATASRDVVVVAGIR